MARRASGLVGSGNALRGAVSGADLGDFPCRGAESAHPSHVRAVVGRHQLEAPRPRLGRQIEQGEDLLDRGRPVPSERSVMIDDDRAPAIEQIGRQIVL